MTNQKNIYLTANAYQIYISFLLDNNPEIPVNKKELQTLWQKYELSAKQHGLQIKEKIYE